MAIKATLINTSPRDSVIRTIEYHIDNQLSDPDWVASNRHSDVTGRDYWTVEIHVSNVTDIEILTLTNMYKESGWDDLVMRSTFREVTSFTLYKTKNT